MNISNRSPLLPRPQRGPANQLIRIVEKQQKLDSASKHLQNNQIIVDLSIDKEQTEELERECERLIEKLKEFSRKMDEIRQTRDESASFWRLQQKLVRIAMRIIRGAYVPHRDYRFLARNNTSLYKKAVSLRRHVADPDRYKALSDCSRCRAHTRRAAQREINAAVEKLTQSSSPAPSIECQC